MSRYDVEVEGRLKALEAKAHSKCDGGRAKLNAAGLPPLASHKDEAYKKTWMHWRKSRSIDRCSFLNTEGLQNPSFFI